MIRLVINADDLGLHPRIDEGIFRAHAEGAVTSASLLATGPSAPEAVRRARREKLPLGLHLCLTTHLNPAAPAGQVRWLAPGGRFRRNAVELAAAWLARLVPAEEVVLELRAQLQAAQHLGADIDHLDTHQQVHLLPGLTSIVEVLAAEHGLPLRWPAPKANRRWLLHPAAAMKSAALSGLARAKQARGVRRIPAHGAFGAGALDEKRLLRLINQLPEGDHEVITHPGMDPGPLKHDPRLRYEWERELAAVTSASVRHALEARGVRLCSFAELTA